MSLSRTFQIANGLGAGNIGDELMAHAFWAHLPGDFLLDVALFPESKRQRQPYPPQHRYHLVREHPMEMEPLSPTAGIIVGSTCITDGEGAGWPLSFLAPRVDYFTSRGLPVDFLGAGVDPLVSSAGREIFERSMLAVRSWTVREEEGRDALLGLGVDPERIVVGADWAWLHDDPVDRCEWSSRYWRELGVEPGAPLLVVNPFYYPDAEKMPAWQQLASALDQLALEHGFTVAFFANECRDPQFDTEAARVTRKMMRAPSVLVPNEYFSPGEAIALLRHASVTIGQRYHFCIQTVLAGSVPVIVGRRGDRMNRLCRQLHRPLCGSYESLQESDVIGQVLDAQRNRQHLVRELEARRRELRERAARNSCFLLQYHVQEAGQNAAL